jgi:hypothetical protein
MLAIVRATTPRDTFVTTNRPGVVGVTSPNETLAVVLVALRAAKKEITAPTGAAIILGINGITPGIM